MSAGNSARPTGPGSHDPTSATPGWPGPDDDGRTVWERIQEEHATRRGQQRLSVKRFLTTSKPLRIFIALQLLFLAWVIWLWFEYVPSAGDYCYDETSATTRLLADCIEDARYWAALPSALTGVLWGVVDFVLITLYVSWLVIQRRRGAAG